MTYSNTFGNLKLDSWYKIFVLIGGLGFLLSLVLPMQAITNRQAMFLCLGILLIGLGEWKNNKILVQYVEANWESGAHYLSTPIRKPDLLGNGLIIIGIFLLIGSFIDIMHIYPIFTR